MGGNAFKGIKPIKREQINSTLVYIVKTLNTEGFTFQYACENLMGSAGKQDESNDLDIAINTKKAILVGQPDNHVFNLPSLAMRAECVLGKQCVKTDTISGGMINTCWPIEGNPHKGLVQVDFIAGNPEWLKFTHFNPGNNISPWKGIMISTMLGVLTKLNVDYLQEIDNIQLAKVGLYYHLERGIERRWFLYDSMKCATRQVDPDAFESANPHHQRFSRLGVIDDPITAIRMIFKQDVPFDQINTFEKLIATIARIFPEQFEEIKDRFIEAYQRSGGRKLMSTDSLRTNEIWSKGRMEQQKV